MQALEPVVVEHVEVPADRRLATDAAGEHDQPAVATELDLPKGIVMLPPARGRERPRNDLAGVEVEKVGGDTVVAASEHDDGVMAGKIRAAVSDRSDVGRVVKMLRHGQDRCRALALVD